MQDGTPITTVSSCSQVRDEHAGHVIVSGSYGGPYNAYNAAKRGVRGVIMCDAGVGKDDAGISGLAYLDEVGVPAATADGMTCHIGDGEHVLEHGIVSYVNRSAEKLGCSRGEGVRACAERMRAGTPPNGNLPPVDGGGRHVVRERAGEPRVVCADTATMVEPEDAGQIVVTGSHGALFRGQPDGLIAPNVYAVFFSDGGIGMDDAGVTRLAELDKRNIPAGTASAESAPIGDARRIYAEGILSRVNDSAVRLGARPGLSLKAFVDTLITRAASASGERA